MLNSAAAGYHLQRFDDLVAQTDHGNITGGQSVAFHPQETTGTRDHSQANAMSRDRSESGGGFGCDVTQSLSQGRKPASEHC